MWGKNVNIKITITNAKTVLTQPIVKSLSDKKISLNITAIFMLEQVPGVINSLYSDVTSLVSVFAGRITDAGQGSSDLFIAYNNALTNLIRQWNCFLMRLRNTF